MRRNVVGGLGAHFAPSSGPLVPPFDLTPRVVVKFEDHLAGPTYVHGAESQLDALGVPWSPLAHAHSGIGLSPLFDSIGSAEIDALVQRARAADPTYRPPVFQRFFHVDAPPGTDHDELAAALRALPGVETAYVSRLGPPPSSVTNPDQNTYATQQKHLGPAPDGIDARYAWGFAGGDGEAQAFMDVEKGWSPNHPDLAAHAIPAPLVGVEIASEKWHGTRVLGVVCALDNASEGIGIAPNLGGVRLLSHMRAVVASLALPNIPDTILKAASVGAFGEVLLLEVQVEYGDMLAPVEVEHASWCAIRLATALGIVVVEAAGNGDLGQQGLNLNQVVDVNGAHFLDPGPAGDPSAAFRDSGAILVTAATSAAPHLRMPYANFGRRIDCYAWGENIVSCNTDSVGTPAGYLLGPPYFGMTSGAAAIVAGAALSVQGLVWKMHGVRLGPTQLREILRDPAHGTPRGAAEPKRIGVMPNLRAIVDDVLEVIPVVYMRDFPEDVGVPHDGAFTNSPDIIVSTGAVAQPQATWGEGSALMDQAGLSTPVKAGQMNRVFVRVRNRGGSAAAMVTVVVFWSTKANRLHPVNWVKIGSANITSVPADDTLTVSGEILWPAAKVPAPQAAAYYLFAILGVGPGPGPAAVPPRPAHLLNMANLKAFVEGNGCVAMRKFQVVP